MRQRPSLFNYGSPHVVANPELHCMPIDAAPGVAELMTQEEPLPVIGSDGMYALDFCIQLQDLQIDFHKGNLFPLPDEIGELPDQRVAVKILICAGVACIDEDALHKMPSGNRLKKVKRNLKKPHGTYTLPTKGLACFCLEVYAVGQIRFEDDLGDWKVRALLDRLEIVDIKPDGLENSLECYVRAALDLSILPGLQIPVGPLSLDIPMVGTITAKPGVNVAVNPSIRADQMHVFLDVEVA